MTPTRLRHLRLVTPNDEPRVARATHPANARERRVVVDLERGISRCIVCGDWEHDTEPHAHAPEAF